MINDLNTNTTNLEFTISGMDLRPAQIKVLISNVQNNSSLKALTMCRKGLTDVEGCEVAEKLANNFYLERLELEGNNLGPETLIQISKLLESNDSLRLVDLEGNRLIRGGDDKPNYRGSSSITQALRAWWRRSRSTTRCCRSTSTAPASTRPAAGCFSRWSSRTRRSSCTRCPS